MHDQPFHVSSALNSVNRRCYTTEVCRWTDFEAQRGSKIVVGFVGRIAFLISQYTYTYSGVPTKLITLTFLFYHNYVS